MESAQGGWSPSEGLERIRPSPPVPFSHFPPAGPVDPLPEILWREIDSLVPPSVSILLPALNEEHGVEAVMKRIPRSVLKRKGLAYAVYLLDGQSTDQTRAIRWRSVACSRNVAIRRRSSCSRGR